MTQQSSDSSNKNEELKRNMIELPTLHLTLNNLFPSEFPYVYMDFRILVSKVLYYIETNIGLKSSSPYYSNLIDKFIPTNGRIVREYLNDGFELSNSFVYDRNTQIYSNSSIRFNIHSYFDHHLLYLSPYLSWYTVISALSFVFYINSTTDCINPRTLPFILSYSLLGSMKYNEDKICTNNYFYRVSGMPISLKQFNRLERKFYDLLNWDLSEKTKIYDTLIFCFSS